MSLRLLRIGDEPRPHRSAPRLLPPGGVSGTDHTTSPERGTGTDDVEPPPPCSACATNRTANPD